MKLLILASLLILPSLSYAGAGHKCDSRLIKCAYGINPGTGCCKTKPHGHGKGHGNNHNAGENQCDTSTLKCANGIDYNSCSCI